MARKIYKCIKIWWKIRKIKALKRMKNKKKMFLLVILYFFYPFGWSWSKKLCDIEEICWLSTRITKLHKLNENSMHFQNMKKIIIWVQFRTLFEIKYCKFGNYCIHLLLRSSKIFTDCHFYYCKAWSPPIQRNTYDSEMRGLIIAISHQTHFSQ